MTKALKSSFILCWLLILICMLPALVSGQDPQVSAEAQVRANLRATTDVNAGLMGEIVAGTRYPVIGRSEFYPWLLLGDPVSLQPIGWVFQDLVTINGNVNSVAYSKLIVSNTLPTPSLSPALTLTPIETFQLQ